MKITKGFDDEERAEVARLYWGAFGGKLGRVLGPDKRAKALIERTADPAHAFCAYDANGALLGVVGFKTFNGALVDPKWREMAARYGQFGTLWRAALLRLLQQDAENTRFLMDGIFVADRAQGQGIGTALLNAIYEEARTHGYAELRLDVIDSNTRARALYEREEFVEVGRHNLGILRHIFGFTSATTMIRKL